MTKRETLSADVLRHGITGRSGLKEKPSYEDFVKYYGGSFDEELDVAKTEKVVSQMINEGKIKAGDFDLIITSNLKRAIGTAEIIRRLLDLKSEEMPIRQSKYLREVEYSAKDIPPEVYAELEDLDQVMGRVRHSFIEHGGATETITDVYHRCLRILDYLRNIKNRHTIRPLFIGHGFIIRFMQLVIKHQHENLTNEQIKNLAREEFMTTRKPKSLTGLRITADDSGAEFINLE